MGTLQLLCCFVHVKKLSKLFSCLTLFLASFSHFCCAISHFLQSEMGDSIGTTSPRVGNKNFFRVCALHYSTGITYDFSTELLSTSDSVLIPIFKHQLPIC